MTVAAFTFAAVMVACLILVFAVALIRQWRSQQPVSPDFAAVSKAMCIRCCQPLSRHVCPTIASMHNTAVETVVLSPTFAKACASLQCVLCQNRLLSHRCRA